MSPSPHAAPPAATRQAAPGQAATSEAAASPSQAVVVAAPSACPPGHRAVSITPQSAASGAGQRVLGRLVGWVAGVDRWWLGLALLSGFALALRLAAADQQSAYMDEGTNVLTGRLLIEHHTVYAEVLNWAYGSYLWPLVAGVADMLGGLSMVRGVTAVCGVVMVLATALAAARLAPQHLARDRRWGVALLAGGVMALAPTAVAVSRFGTYDALAGACFMLAIALLVPIGRARVPHLLLAAALLFVAFLSKYLVAIYFPFVCAYLVLGAGRDLRLALRGVVWFALPLAAACGVYLLVFLGPLLTLLTSSMHYSDLKSADPLHEYVWTRPELWLLLALAILAGRGASRQGRLVAAVGLAIILAFQLEARPDFDFWKHSIYVVYFLAPLVGLWWLRVPQNTGTWRVVAAGSAAAVAVLGWTPVNDNANQLTGFYPNLNALLPAIDQYTSKSAQVLTDDTALRYYLYPRLSTDDVIGPFGFDYRGQNGADAYRSAIADRFFDTIVLDGGVTPQGNAIRQQLGDTIDQFYQPAYTTTDANGFAEEILTPKRPAGTTSADDDPAPWPVALSFDDPSAVEQWGAHPDVGNWQPGLQVAPSSEREWDGHLSLRFVPTPQASALSLRRSGSVSRVRTRLLLLPAAGTSASEPVRVGFMGFDAGWQWRDDGFRWEVPFNTWTTISWDLAQPTDFEEIGLKLPPTVGTAYLGSFEIDP